MALCRAVHTHACKTHTHTHTPTHARTDTLQIHRLTSLPSLDAAQCEDVLLIGEELPHLVERLLSSDGQLVPWLWSGQDLAD